MAYSLEAVAVLAMLFGDFGDGCGLCSQHHCPQTHANANVTSPRHRGEHSSSPASTPFRLHFAVLILIFVDMLLIGLLH